MPATSDYKEEFRRIIRLIESYGEMIGEGYVILEFNMRLNKLVVDHRGPEAPVIQLRVDHLKGGPPSIDHVTLCADGTFFLPDDKSRKFKIEHLQKINKHNLLNKWT